MSVSLAATLVAALLQLTPLVVIMQLVTESPKMFLIGQMLGCLLPIFSGLTLCCRPSGAIRDQEDLRPPKPIYSFVALTRNVTAVLVMIMMLSFMIAPSAWNNIGSFPATELAAVDVLLTILLITVVYEDQFLALWKWPMPDLPKLTTWSKWRVLACVVIGVVSEVLWCEHFWRTRPDTIDPRNGTVPSWIVTVAMVTAGSATFNAIARENPKKWAVWALFTMMVGAHICSGTAIYLILTMISVRKTSTQRH